MFLALVPFVLMYLIRPKAIKLKIPTLMFFVRSKNIRKRTSFLRNILRDWLFLLQLLILLLLIVQTLSPSSIYEYSVGAKNTVVVLDVSASSQVGNRFDRILDEAKSVLGSSNTIILAKGSPYIGLEDATKTDALDFLRRIQPRDTESSIGEAMILGGETLHEEEGRVIVISDFLNTNGLDPETAKNVLESKGIIVDMINVGEAKSNVGITDLQVDKDTSTVYIRNFDKGEKLVPLKIGDVNKNLKIPPQSVETFSFETPNGLTKIEIEVEDDLEIDNIAYLSAPEDIETKILLITNDPKKSVFIKNAFLAQKNIKLEVSEPPIISKDDYDIYIIHSVNPESILPGTFEDISHKIDDGSGMIIYAQPDLGEIQFKGLLPVDLKGKGSGVSVIIDQLNKFTRNVDFGRIEEYHKAESKSNVITLARGNNNTIIAQMQKGKGSILYFGVMDESSDFKYSPEYPIFWKNVVEVLTNSKDVRNLNSKIGNTLLLNKEERIKTPLGTIRQTSLLYEDVGLYELEDRTIAVNLLNDQESDITRISEIGQSSKDYTLKEVKEKRDLNFEIPLIICALIMLFIELFYIKIRGDV